MVGVCSLTVFSDIGFEELDVLPNAGAEGLFPNDGALSLFDGAEGVLPNGEGAEGLFPNGEEPEGVLPNEGVEDLLSDGEEMLSNDGILLGKAGDKPLLRFGKVGGWSLACIIFLFSLCNCPK